MNAATNSPHNIQRLQEDDRVGPHGAIGGAPESDPTLDRPLSLTEAAKLAPGRPSTNCIWRWCRRGVMARSQERVKLEHMRIGGKLFTTPRWMNEFGRRLAAADAHYFDRTGRVSEPNALPGRTRVPTTWELPVASHAEVERELAEAGL
jgi:hypothetical protein